MYEECKHFYQQVISLLLYLMMGTCPDITFAITKMSQYAVNPSNAYLNAVLHICHYLSDTANYALVYGASKEDIIVMNSFDLSLVYLPPSLFVLYWTILSTHPIHFPHA